MIMSNEQITGWVDCLLDSWAVFDADDEHNVYTVLRLMLRAWAYYELMTDNERALVTALCKKMQDHFDTKCMLKERKRKTTKEKFPLKPLLKEKEKKEIEKKVCVCVCDAKEAFRKECLAFVGEYDKQLVANFFNYFTQPSPKTGKMLFQEQRHWSTKNRLELWVNNQHSSDIMAAAERLKKARGKQQKEQSDAKAMQQLAAERERANAEQERQRAESKAGAVTREEWLAMKAERERNNEGNDARTTG